jgi:imidazolonepropionase-like amidohydrolase
VDILTHVPIDGPITAEVAGRLAAEGRAVVPTLTMMGPIVERWPEPGLDYGHARASVAALRAAGVPILAGTDANDIPASPTPIPHGASLHRELELLVEAGLSPAEALDSATRLPAVHFGLLDRGVIKPGYRADLVLLDGDPLADIRASMEIRSVWCNGIEAKQQVRVPV